MSAEYVQASEMSLLNNLKKWPLNMSVYFLGGAFYLENGVKDMAFGKRL